MVPTGIEECKVIPTLLPLQMVGLNVGVAVTTGIGCIRKSTLNTAPGQLVAEVGVTWKRTTASVELLALVADTVMADGSVPFRSPPTISSFILPLTIVAVHE